ncbi:MAG: PaaI family thioesterase [bacterium]|nr:PaaI family thioesterase [bacterium]
MNVPAAPDSDQSPSERPDIFAWAPISQLMGLEVQPGTDGQAIVYLNVDQRMHNPMGFVHGGVIALLADAATGIAFGRTLQDQQSFATVEMKTCYIRPVKKARLKAEANIVQRGLRIGFVECRILDQRQKLVATASCTCTVNSLGT